MPRKSKSSDGRRNNRPPAQYQFRRGQSGNNKGRPKSPPPTVLDLVEEELDSKHSINVGTRQIQVPLKRLLVKQLFRLALKGNIKALLMSLEMLDTIQKANVKRHAQMLKPRIKAEDFKNMTEEELTALYFKTLRQVDGNDEEDA
jgi:hypothetical protein